jgi:hypothetical protein
MIVIGIIGILAAVLFPSYTAYIERSRDMTRTVNIQKVYNRLSEYLSEKWSFAWMNSAIVQGINPWYYVPINNLATDCWPSYPVLPSIAIFPDLSQKDFNNISTVHPCPLILMQRPWENVPGWLNIWLFWWLTNNTDINQYTLHWTLPGISDANTGATIHDPTNFTVLNKRCLPGTVRWINRTPGYTACHMLIWY